MQTTIRWAVPRSPIMAPALPDDERVLRDLGKRIVAYRKQRGWNQTELGKRLDRRQATISRWENGLGEMTIPDLVALARVFKVTLDELVLGRKCPD